MYVLMWSKPDPNVGGKAFLVRWPSESLKKSPSMVPNIPSYLVFPFLFPTKFFVVATNQTIATNLYYLLSKLWSY
jgi:hypothetical protein